MDTSNRLFSHHSRQRLREFTNRWWIWEIISSTISIILLVVIFVLLYKNNSQDIYQWPLKWTLNSLVVFLATLAQIAMMVPLAAGISQLKWVWYKENHALADMDEFDQASRGPLGALSLLGSLGFKYLASFGAILILLTFLFHKLIQQTISTKSGSMEFSDMAGAPWAMNYSYSYNYATGNAIGDQGPVADMVAAIDYAAMYGLSEGDLQFEYLPYNCETGNCSWRHIQTLGVCSKCADISDLIMTSGNNWFVSNGLMLNNDYGIISSAGLTEYPDATKLPDIGPMIIKFVAMAHDPDSSNPPVGVDCALYWCVYEWWDFELQNNMTISFDPSSSIWTDTNATQTFYKQLDDIVLTPPTCFNDQGISLPDSTPCVKTITPNAQVALQNFFMYTFTGSANKSTTVSDAFDIDSQFAQILFTTSWKTADWVLAYTQIMENIALEMTNNIRQQPYDGVNTAYALGTTYLWVPLFDIRWGYMVVPTLLVVFSAIFLVATIIKSRGQEKWKSSSLPLFFHGLRYAPVNIPEDLGEMKEAATTTVVHLEKSNHVSHFVQEPQQ